MDALGNAVSKIYENIAQNGNVTENQLALIVLYERKNKPKRKDAFDQLLEYGKKIVSVLNENLNIKE